MIAALVGMIVLVIRKADRIENQVVMNMIPVYVGGQDKLVPAAQDLPCKLHADLMGLLRRDLARLKGLDQVAAQVRSLVDGMAAGPGKFDIRSFGGAAIGRNKQLSIRLFRVADIVNGRLLGTPLLCWNSGELSFLVCFFIIYKHWRSAFQIPLRLRQRHRPAVCSRGRCPWDRDVVISL